ncbi:GNAT family N-acetyltransferase [Pseudomonas leptonychotis]|uniref:GNAT family N-acetyltransferase n=1 Tax=Pseudomonas leptonychotis TaxID=2448482 RepID=UPI0039F01D1F
MRLLDADDPSLAAFASQAARYVNRHAERGIGNLQTQLLLLDLGRWQMPVSINQGGERPNNCYVVSPLTAYSGYARDELQRLQRPWLARMLRPMVDGVEKLLSGARIERIAQVNNWLLSTNLYPTDWRGEELGELTALLRTRFPAHAFGFRSLNATSNGELLVRLRALGYLAVPSRQVYLFDGRDGANSAYLRHHNCRLDATLLRRSGYRVERGEALSVADFARLEHLYNLLYLNKYSPLNPHYSAAWLRQGQADGWLELCVLRSTYGRIDGVVGWFASDTVLSAPIVGYDTALAQRIGLYRQLTRLCLEEAANRRMLLNFSSGAAHFKRLRGGQPEIEYSMVQIAHLPLRQRLVWRLLAVLLRGIGVPLMRIFKL